MPPSQHNASTRSILLQAATHKMHRNGFRAASIDSILRKTGLTKGALYHHFRNKRALGYAAIDEVIGPHVLERWVVPLHEIDDPVVKIIDMLQAAADRLTPEDILLGCALNNLAQEMSPVDSAFRMRVHRVFNEWHKGFEMALSHGQTQGTVKSDVDTASAASFIIAAIEGCLGMAKNAQSPEMLNACAHTFRQFLMGLRPDSSGAKK
ncbi:MAG: TetR family transcriptional regulator C-terminal domain-containing protein [Gammaproteobacteria bacterium]|nr:TetR family transcriptional regulator C-terminal domain-containing protein [Gammaproteobacteria bacterium]